MNEDGFSWVESILSLAICMIIFGIFIPIIAHMQQQLNDKKTQMHAADVAVSAIITYRQSHQLQGTFDREKVTFSWRIDENTLCVYVEQSKAQEDRILCID